MPNKNTKQIDGLLKDSDLDDRDIEAICDMLEDSDLGPFLAKSLDNGEIDKNLMNRIRDKQIERAEKLFSGIKPDPLVDFHKEMGGKIESFKEKSAARQKQPGTNSFKSFFCCGFGSLTSTPTAYASLDEEDNTQQRCCTLQ